MATKLSCFWSYFNNANWHFRFSWAVLFFLFFGLIFLIARGLAATHNLQMIVKYRTIGINTFKEQEKSCRQAFQNVSLGNRIKSILPYLVEAFICFITYVILFAIYFPLVIRARYLVFGLITYFITAAFYSLKLNNSFVCLCVFLFFICVFFLCIESIRESMWEREKTRGNKSWD